MTTPTATAAGARPKLDVVVDKPTPYTFDLGLLLANDPNPFDSSSPAGDASAPLEDRLSAAARDGAQALINQLLTTCALQSTTDGVLLSLPSPDAHTTPLPREKPVPAAREPSKWERFAARKGIAPKTREAREARTRRFDEATGQWTRSWGHDRDGRAADRVNARDRGAVQKDWLVEVDERAEREAREEGGGGAGKGKAKAKGKKR